MSDLRKCSGIGCAVRDTCKRYTDIADALAYREEMFSVAFYATDSFRPATGCEYYWPTPGIEGRIGADFDKARE